jgi:hypothetical protein
MARSKRNDGVAVALKEQLLLVSFLVLFAGMISTDTYYAAFGLKYQFLDLPTEHLIYRGITALTTNWSLGVAYALSIFWLATGWSLLLSRFPKREQWLDLMTYLIVLLVMGVGYYSAINSGAKAAAVDLCESTSELPKVEEATDTNDKKIPIDGYRVLLSGKDTVAVFRATDQVAQVPFIHLLKREDIRELTLLR